VPDFTAINQRVEEADAALLDGIDSRILVDRPEPHAGNVLTPCAPGLDAARMCGDRG
jgi:hypothetical protein